MAPKSSRQRKQKPAVEQSSGPQQEPMRPVFRDTATNSGLESFPGWGEIYRRLKDEDYPQVVPPADPDDRDIDDHVFPNIRAAHLHIVGARTAVLPCSEIIEWILNHADTDARTIVNDQGRTIASFQPVDLEK
jgi:hypothetical protein